MYNMLFLTLLH